MNLLQGMEFNSQNIPTWIEWVTNDLIDKINKKINSQTENEYFESCSKIHIFLCKDKISSSNVFNDWFINTLITKGFDVDLQFESFDEKNNYHLHKLTLSSYKFNMFVDLSNGMICKYIVGPDGSYYKSMNPISFESVDFFLCGESGYPFKVTFEPISINHMMELAERKLAIVNNPTNQSVQNNSDNQTDNRTDNTDDHPINVVQTEN
jgi:hypothetical protein